MLDAGATVDLPDADVAGFLDDFDFDGDVDEDDLNTDASLGRLAVTTTNSETSGCDITDGQAFANGTVTCVFDALYVYGGRSFSIYNAETRQRVFDSGSDFETITAERLGDSFNADNTENASFDSRSDAKGPEPEAVTLAEIGGKTYAFIGVERVGGVMVYDVSVPEDARFVQYVNTRDFAAMIVEDDASTYESADLGPEAIEFVPAADSPTGEPLIAVGHEITGTIAVFRVGQVEVGS